MRGAARARDSDPSEMVRAHIYFLYFLLNLSLFFYTLLYRQSLACDLVETQGREYRRARVLSVWLYTFKVVRPLAG